MLALRRIETAYGDSQVLFGVSLEVRAGEVVTLLGRNGMGKTTTVRSIMGLSPIRAGEILFEGRPIHGLAPYKVAQAGLGLVPEGRQVFPNLTVRENLVATAAHRATVRNATVRNATVRHAGVREPWTVERIFALFPPLEHRCHAMGGLLSGGEQQMLAIGRALMTNPVLLILDEATEGLAPLIRRDIWACLAALKAAGQSILIIDKNVEALIRLADRHYVLEKGEVVWSGPSAALAADEAMQHRYLGV